VQFREFRVRLDKYIAKSTTYVVAQALVFIKNQRVSVNDQLVTEASYQVHSNNYVMLDGKRLTPRDSRYIMLNKPKGMVCSNVDDVYPSIFKLLDVDYPSQLHIVGRLDVDTTGLVLITDDGHWSFNLTSPHFKREKIYKVGLTRPISSDAVQCFLEGIALQGETALTLPAKLKIIDEYNVLLTLTEGRYHQVKRMFFAIGNKVKTLHRQQIDSLTLDIEVGQWRHLTLNEVKGLSIKSYKIKET